MKKLPRRIIFILVFSVLFMVIVFYKHLQLIYDYRKIITSPSQKKLLHYMPVIKKWDLKGKSNSQNISVAFMRFHFPFGPIRKIWTASNNIIYIDSPSVKRFLLTRPITYNLKKFKEHNLSLAKYKIERGISIPDVNLWDGAESVFGYGLTEDKWREIENNSNLMAYWQKYVNNPYLWRKTALTTSYKNYLTLLLRNTNDFLRYMSTIKSKIEFLEHVDDCYLFETPHRNGIIRVFYRKEATSVTIQFWDTDYKIINEVDIDFLAKSIPIDKVCEFAESFQYDVERIMNLENMSDNNKYMQYNRIIIEDLSKLPTFEVNIDNIIEMIDSRDYSFIAFKKLIKQIPNINECSNYTIDDYFYKNISLLHVSVCRKRTDFAELLLKRGIDVNTKADRDETPLHIAARYDDKEMIKLLLSYGANVNAKDLYGFTPLALASSKEAVELLKPHTINNSLCLKLNDWEMSLQEARKNAESLLLEYIGKKYKNNIIYPQSMIKKNFSVSHKINLYECYYLFTYNGNKNSLYFSSCFLIKISAETGKAEIHETNSTSTRPK